MNIQVLLLVTMVYILWTLNACSIAEAECSNYTVRLFYHYNHENTSRENVLPHYVKWITAYIFNSEGVLCAIHPVFWRRTEKKQWRVEV
ncbi:hypothetical protein [Bacteroides sp. 519]|uniref:hypothetical protein n=1 Tax=Bacteroides sp. 519 TaxID=2302937 RepID=UPI0013D00E1C|nr:hypothetical protein [Bacteroides sp. 519]NDV56902.1 hypothetical protein [Bacteroides sp. 519]